MAHALDLTDQNFDAEALSGVVLVDFQAPWCAPCRQMAPLVDALAAEYAGRARVFKVDVDDNPGLAARYGVRGLPTVMVLKNGEVAGMATGAQTRAGLEALLASAL